MLQVGLAAVCQ